MASERWRQWARRLVTAAVLVAMLAPLIEDEDGLPFSTYPMYSGTRSNEINIVTAVGISPTGEMVTLSMPTIADTRDPLIAQSYLNDAVSRRDTESVCQVIASRAPELARVEIATERHDAIKRVRREPSLLSRTIHSSCGPSQ